MAFFFVARDDRCCHCILFTFPSWFVMVYISLIVASDNATQKMFVFITILLQQTKADAQTTALVLFCQFLQNPMCTKLCGIQECQKGAGAVQSV
jgi:hypothetical protein